CNDTGLNSNDTSFIIDKRMLSALSYLENALDYQQNHNNKGSLELLYCLEFANRVAPTPKMSEESTLDRRFQITDIAKEDLSIAQSTLKALQKTYRLIIQ